jgi:hypothetical protein
VPSATQGLDLLGGNADPGSNALATVTLDPGDYYVAVVDSAGVPTPYALCIAVGADCSLPAPTGTASPTVSPSPSAGEPVRPRRAVRARSGIERPRP